MLVNIWVRDKYDGYVHQVGTDEHDSLELMDGKVEYVNLQCMCGTCGGDYEFVDAPDPDGYVSVTPEQLMMNKKLIHEKILKILEENEDENNEQCSFNREADG